MANQRIRIRLKAFDHRLIDQSAREIVDTAKLPAPGSWADTAADQERALYRADFTARQQRCSGSVRDSHP